MGEELQADQKEIAKALGRCPSTISRELQRNRTGNEYYSGRADGRASGIGSGTNQAAVSDSVTVIGRIKCSQLWAEWAAGVLVSPDNRWICHRVQVSSAGGVFFFRLLLAADPVGGMAGFEVVSSPVGIAGMSSRG